MMNETEFERFRRQMSIVTSPTGLKFSNKLWEILERDKGHDPDCEEKTRKDCTCSLGMRQLQIMEMFGEIMLQDGYETMAEEREER